MSIHCTASLRAFFVGATVSFCVANAMVIPMSRARTGSDFKKLSILGDAFLTLKKHRNVFVLNNAYSLSGFQLSPVPVDQTGRRDDVLSVRLRYSQWRCSRVSPANDIIAKMIL